MARRILVKTGAEASAAGTTFHNREPSLTASALKFRMGGKVVGKNELELLTPSAAASVTAALKTYRRNHKIHCTPGVGGAAYTYKIVLPILVASDDAAINVAPESGDTVDITIFMPASANPTVQIRNDSAAATTLVGPTAGYLSIAGDAAEAGIWQARCEYNGTAWAVTSVQKSVIA